MDFSLRLLGLYVELILRWMLALVKASCPFALWKQLAEFADALAMKPCLCFVEFDALDLWEDANMIWRSEW